MSSYFAVYIFNIIIYTFIRFRLNSHELCESSLAEIFFQFIQHL